MGLACLGFANPLIDSDQNRLRPSVSVERSQNPADQTGMEMERCRDLDFYDDYIRIVWEL